MLAARVARLPLACFVSSVKPTTFAAPKRLPTLVCRTQGFSQQQGGRAGTLRKMRDATGPSLKERIMAPAGDGGM